MATWFPFSSRNAQYAESRRNASWGAFYGFPSVRQPVFVHSLNEKTLRVRVSLSRKSPGTSTLSITRASILVRISIISLRMKHGKNFCLNRRIDIERRRKLPRRILKFMKRRCCNIARKSRHLRQASLFAAKRR